MTPLESGASPPSVSVIIIFLDAAAYLAEAIESVLAQTLTDWELLLVDDGSSDFSTELAKEYARRRPMQITYLEHSGHQNLGKSAARNLGLERSRGRYVAFLDADDVYLPERLQRHVDILDRMPDIDMVQSELIHWYSWEAAERRSDEDYVRPFLGVGDRVLVPPEGLMLALAVPLYSAGICNVTVRRHMALIGFEPQFREIYEDQVFLSKLYLEWTTYVLQATLARYRKHPNSTMRRAKEQGGFVDGLLNSTTLTYYAWLCEYAKAKGATHPLLLELLEPLQSMIARHREQPAPSRLAAFVVKLKGLLPRIMSKAMYRCLLRWNRAREFRHARRQYEALCARLTDFQFNELNKRMIRQPARQETTSATTAEPLVSVIMIFLNAEEFVDAAIGSVIAQTYSSWELLLVDDGSTDASSGIAQRYAASYPDRIRYIEHASHANRGTGPSRNLGLAMAKGRYTTFLDADDIYLPERLEKHVAVLEREPQVGLVISQDLLWRTWLPEARRDPRRVDEIVGPVAAPNVPIEPPTLLEFTLRTRGAAVPAVCSITFRRALALNLGSIPDRFVDWYEDQALLAKLLIATPCVVLSENLAKYRQHSGSLTARSAQRGEYRPGRAHERRLEFLRWLLEYSKVAAPTATALHAAVHRQLWPTRHPALSAAHDALRSVLRAARITVEGLVPAALSRGMWGWVYKHRRRKVERQLARAREAMRPLHNAARD